MEIRLLPPIRIKTSNIVCGRLFLHLGGYLYVKELHFAKTKKRISSIARIRKQLLDLHKFDALILKQFDVFHSRAFLYS